MVTSFSPLGGSPSTDLKVENNNSLLSINSNLFSCKLLNCNI